jgi:hypothetical protein
MAWFACLSHHPSYVQPRPVFKQLSVSATYVSSAMSSQRVNYQGGIHVLDFFVLGFWDSLPSDWTDWFATVDNATVRQDLISGLDSKSFWAVLI